MISRPGVLIVAAGCLMIHGCGPTEAGPGAGEPGEAEAGVVDDAGVVHPVAVARARVLSLVPGMTETVVALGGGDLLVGRTRYDEQAELAVLPSVGGGLDPNLERLAELAPDLVIAWKDAGGMGTLSGRLQGIGVPVYQVAIQSTRDFRRHASNLGRLLHLIASADSLLEAVDDGLLAVRAAVAGRPAPSILFLAQRDPPMAAGPGTFIDSLLVAAGGTNVLSGDPGVLVDWPMVSLEDILWRDPDFIVVPVVGIGEAADARRFVPPEVDALLEAPGWREVAAISERRVIAVDAGLFSRPGPRMAVAAASLASRLHPDAEIPRVLTGRVGAERRGAGLGSGGAQAPPAR